MTKYDTLLQMGGAEVIDVREFYTKHKNQIKEVQNKDFKEDKDATVFDVCLVEILNSVGISGRTADDYDFKFVVRKKS